jgi:WD40 repeat protein
MRGMIPLILILSTCLAAGQTLAGPRGAIVRLGTEAKVEDATRPTEQDVTTLVFSADGASIAAGRPDGTLIIHDIAGQKEAASFKAHDKAIVSVVRRGKSLITASTDATIKEWDATGKPIRTITKLPGPAQTMTISNSGKRLAVGMTGDGLERLVIVELAAGLIVQRYKGPPFMHQLAFAPDDLTLLVAGHEVLQMWNLATNRRQWSKGEELKAGAGSPDSPSHSGCAFTADEKYGAATVDSPTQAYVLIWDAKTGKGHKRFPTRSGQVAFAFSPDSRWIAIGGSKPEVALYDVETGKLALDFENVGQRVLSIAFSPDGRKLATGSRDGTISVWDMAAAKRNPAGPDELFPGK